MIEARGLTKRYGSTLAVDDLSFEVLPGRVTGFLGPNGAGKSTTLRMVMGLDAPTGGSVTISGQPYASLHNPLFQVGAMLEATAIHEGRSARNHLLWVAQSNGIGAKRVDEVLGMVGLTGVADRRAGMFSMGMRQRLGIGVALLGDPELLIFDEPVNGLDPEGIVWIRDFMRSLASEGRTVFVSSHLMAEMALTADHVIVIGRGKLLAEASVDDLIHGSAQNYVRVRSPHTKKLATLVVKHGGTTKPDPDAEDALAISGLSAADIGELAATQGVVLHELSPQEASLEEAYMELTHDSVEYRADAANREGGLSMAVTQVMQAEWTKVRSIRSTYWTLFTAAVVTIGMSSIVCAVIAAQYSGMSLQDRASIDPASISLTGGILAQLAVAVFGVLVITSEYASGMIRTTFAAVPQRLSVLSAKVAVFTGVTLTTMTAACFAAFFTGQVILGTKDIGVGIGSPAALRTVVGTALYLTGLGLLALGLGTLIRKTAGAITAVVGVVFVLPAVTSFLPSSLDVVQKFLPSNAGEAMLSGNLQRSPGDPDILSPWLGLGVFFLYAAVTLVFAATALSRRDA